ncbi:MAG: protein translocase subunit SecD, partial [Planctomycetes bacterium]|nr:protein translocase subunit SecD [Planctomycetota bacterium]
MTKNLMWKFILIFVLVGLCILEIYPPSEKLKPGIDLAGGTSLLYVIDDSDMEAFEKQELAQNMIRILRQRIDPDNRTNMVWRAHGTNRIEIQMPLATKETLERRRKYIEKLDTVGRFNLDKRKIRQYLVHPEGLTVEEYQSHRQEQFEVIAGENQKRLELLNDLAQAHDALIEGQKRRDGALEGIEELTSQLGQTEINLDAVNVLVKGWDLIDDPNRGEHFKVLQADDPTTQSLIQKYIEAKNELSVSRTAITGDEGLEAKLEQAWGNLETDSIDLDKLKKILEGKNIEREEEISSLKARFPDRVQALEELNEAYKAYSKDRGQLDDPEDLMRKLRGSGVLEFRILPMVNEGVLGEADVKLYRDRLESRGPDPKKSGDDRYAWRKIKNAEEFRQDAFTAEFAGQTYVLASNLPEEILLHEKGGESWKLTGAQPSTDQLGTPSIAFQLNEIGAKQFLKLTKANLNRPLCILLDDVAVTAPNLSGAIYDSGEITGSFTPQDVRDLVDTLNAGSLPARLGDQPISQHTVGPTVGRDNLEAGRKAAIMGLIAVAVFMISYYMLPGLLASMALFLNLLFVLGVMAFSNATFTLPGIAGLILTIGMAVDANVLIFERIREEQKRGSSLRIAIRNGYDRAFRTILDANITTFIVAAILYMVASEEVKGFTITLMIGIVSSMFTALFVTRAVFDLLIGLKILKNKLPMLQIVRSPQINWMGAKRGFWLASAVLVIGGWSIFLSRDEDKNSKYSIELTGGTSVHVHLNANALDMNRQDIQDAIRQVGKETNNKKIESAVVQKIGEGQKFEIVTTETNRVVVEFTIDADQSFTAEAIREAVVGEAAKLGDRRLKEVSVEPGEQPGSFVLTSTQSNTNRVREVLKAALGSVTIQNTIAQDTVNGAIRKALAGKLDVQDNLEPTDLEAQPITSELIRKKPYLEAHPGGLLIRCDFGNGKSETLGRLKDRFEQVRIKPEFEKYGDHPRKLFSPDNLQTQDEDRLVGLEFVVTSADLDYEQSSAFDWQGFVDDETERVTKALEWTTSLPRVTQIDPSIGRESLMSALVAIFLSLIAI